MYFVYLSIHHFRIGQIFVTCNLLYHFDAEENVEIEQQRVGETIKNVDRKAALAVISPRIVQFCNASTRNGPKIRRKIENIHHTTKLQSASWKKCAK